MGGGSQWASLGKLGGEGCSGGSAVLGALLPWVRDGGISEGLDGLGLAAGLSPTTPAGSQPSCPGSWGGKKALRVLFLCPSSVVVKGLRHSQGLQVTPPPKNTEHRSRSIPRGCLLRPHKHPVQTGRWWRWPPITPQVDIFLQHFQSHRSLGLCCLGEGTLWRGHDLQAGLF